MKVLLHTRLLPWWLAASPSLPEPARALIGAPENDRMLVAQAQAENLILATADEVVAAYGDFVQFLR